MVISTVILKFQWVTVNHVDEIPCYPHQPDWLITVFNLYNILNNNKLCVVTSVFHPIHRPYYYYIFYLYILYLNKRRELPTAGYIPVPAHQIRRG